jgi:plastocyanin
MSNKVFFGLLLLVAVILTGWFMLRGPNQTYKSPAGNLNAKGSPIPTSNLQNPSNLAGDASQSGNSLSKGGEKERMVVTYTDTGFAPKPLKVVKGTKVTFVNESSRGMWVASDVHPTHQLLPGFDQLSTVSKNGVYEYVFEKVGTWKYHNHVNPTDTGTVIVTE